jgi:hypothetical protein
MSRLLRHRKHWLFRISRIIPRKFRKNKYESISITAILSFIKHRVIIFDEKKSFLVNLQGKKKTR